MTGDHIVKVGPPRTRGTVLAAFAASTVTAVLLLVHCPAPAAAAEPGSLTSESFSYTGAPQTYAVPAGVGSIAGEVIGGNGGAGGVGKRNVGVPTVVPLLVVAGPFYGEPTNGGIGGSTQGTLNVTPGENLTIQVGGAGANGSTGTETTPAAGGYNGGAPSGTTESPKSDGGGGGGSSEILSSDTPLLVGGGGGGGGGTFLGSCAFSSSGAIGNGGNGGENGPPGDGENGASAGESEEVRNTVVVAPAVAYSPPPTDGEGGSGGSAAHPGGEHGNGLPGGSDENSGGSGGGGGGGYYGGSGGAFGGCRAPGALTGGGGGGGSDYAAPSATDVVYQRTVNSGGESSGAVTLSYYVPYPTSTQAAPSPASASVGETITLTATVTSSGGNCPGTLQFEVDGAPVGSPVTVQNGKAQTTTTAPSAGNHPITATYSGTLSSATQAGCLPSTSTPSTLSVLYPTSTHATPNPSSAGVGETITITATVIAPTGVSCPGTVQFEIDGKPIGNPVTVQSGTAQTTTKAPAAGNHPITATYSGAPSTEAQAGCLTSTSAPSTLSVPYPTTTQAAPSPASANVGETVTITATITAPPGVSCPGTVQFEIDGKPIGNPVAVQNGTAQTTTTAPPAGEHPILAAYSGTPSTPTQAGCLPSISAPTTLTTKSPALSQAEALVRPRACQSARHFTIHLQLPRQQKLLSAHVYVDHKLAKTLTDGTRSYHLNLRGRPYSTVIVTLTATEAGGRQVTGERIYHTCRAHKLPGHTKFNI